MIRASSVGRGLLCPPSLKETETPYNPPNPDSILGVGVHEALAIQAADWQLEHIAKTYNLKLDELSELFDAGQVMRKDLALLFPNWEAEFALQSESLGLSGHIDVIGQDENQLSVLDWKSGHGFDSDHWPQLMSYLLLAREKFGPRLSYYAAIGWLRTGRVEGREVTDEQLDAFAEKIKALPSRALEYNPGEACARCPRQLECPAKRNYVQTAMSALSNSPWGDITPNEMGEIYEKTKVAEKALKQIKDAIRIEVQARNGLPLPNGKTLVEQERTRKKIDVQKAWAVLVAEFGAERLAPLLSLSVTDAKELAGQTAAKGEKKQSQEELMAKLDACGSVASSTYKTLVAVKPKG